MDSRKQEQPSSQQQQQQQQPPQQIPSLSPELMAVMQASIAKGVEEALRNSLSNLTVQPANETASTTPSSPMSPCAVPRVAGLAAPQSSADALTTEESKCFMLAESVIREGVSGICAHCAHHLTPRQRVVATSSGRGLTVSSSDCCICQMKTLTPESFTKPFCQFLTDNPTIFHAVDYFKEKMNAVGFTEVWLCSMYRWLGIQSD